LFASEHSLELSFHLSHGLGHSLAGLNLAYPVLAGERRFGRQLFGIGKHIPEAAILHRCFHARDDGLHAHVLGGVPPLAHPPQRSRSISVASAGSASASSIASATLRKDLASSWTGGAPSCMWRSRPAKLALKPANFFTRASSSA